MSLVKQKNHNVEKKPIKLSGKIHVKMNSGKKRKNSSARWLQRHLNDQYVLSSKKHGYRSRAAFKLEEINKEFCLINKSSKILDLGAAPGSWSQIAGQITTNQIISVDLINIEPLNNVSFIQGDIYDQITIDSIYKLSESKFDVIMSDMAPNTIGHPSTDHLKIIALAERVIEIADDMLRIGGSLIIKIFQGSEEKMLINQLAESFEKVKRFKPKSSRSESSEMFIIAQKFKKND